MMPEFQNISRTTLSQETSPEDLLARLNNRETFVVNVGCTWCGDCIEQKPHLVSFEDVFDREGVNFFHLTVQNEHGVMLSDSHRELAETLGADVIKQQERIRYPLTVLVVNGQIDEAQFEITTPEGLMTLSDTFINRINTLNKGF